jgi:hypothetical protein
MIDILLNGNPEPDQPPMAKAEDFISTEQRQAYTPFQQKVLDYITHLGAALIKIDLLAPEVDMPQGGFLISYKIREHDIEMVKLPRDKHVDAVWTMLALHIEKRSQELG